MQETIWLGNIVRVGSKTPRYLYNEMKNTIEFRTMKDKKELGWLDKEKNIIYFNYDYDNQFKAIKKQIIKDFNIDKIESYCNLRGVI